MYNFYKQKICNPRGYISKLLLTMRLTTLILFVAVMQVTASSVAQKITLYEKNTPAIKVFDKIREQSGYDFIITSDILKQTKRISIDVKNANLADVLDQIFDQQILSYEIREKVIVVSKKTPSVLDKVMEVFSRIDINGKVSSESGRLLPGATVKIKGTEKVVRTNQNGEFHFSGVAEDAILVFSYIGYESKEVPVKGQAIFSVVLKEQQQELKDVVISTGYSIKKVGELTGSVQRISGDDLRKGITTSDPASLLKGRVTGLYISEQNAGDPTSSGGQIFVRGQSSIAGVGLDQYNEIVIPTLNYGPLLVLDGVIMPNQNLKDLITPQEIEDIVILKDAAATAIYGSRAAAGVIVVNTKRGKNGNTRVSGEIKYGLNLPNRGTIRFLNGQELFDVQKRFYTEDYKVNNASISPTYPTVQDYLNYKLPSMDDVNKSFDWEKYGFVNSNTKEINVAASGGTDKTKYYIGSNYYNEQSTGVNNGLVRKTFRLNLQTELSDRLAASVSINGIDNKGILEPFNTGTTLYSLVPWASPYNADGSLKPILDYKLDGFAQQTGNPIFDNQFNQIRRNAQLIFGSVKLDYKITDWLTLSSTNSLNLNYTKNETYIDVRSYAGSGTITSPQGYFGTNLNNLNSYLTSNQLAFNKRIGEHSLRALAAMEFGKTSNDKTLINVNNVRAGYPAISMGRQLGASYDLSAFGVLPTKAGNLEGGKDERIIYSLFGELGYTFRDRYSLSASLRSDASSSFGRDNRYGTFYSAGAAWIVSSEEFMKSLAWVSNLKLRANYGTSGSQLGDNFLSQTLYDPRYAYSGQPIAQISVLGNPALRWEVTKTASAGIDFELFKRVTASVDAYSRRSENLLQKVTLPAVSGFPNQWQNAASVKNDGLEVLISTDNIVNKKFRWSTSFNISFNKNKITSIANDSITQGYSYSLYKGDDINSLKAVKYTGVDPQTGKPLFEKLIFDNQGAITGRNHVNTVAEVGADLDPRQYQTIGSYQPKYYGGLTNNLIYKQFSLSILITYAGDYFMTDELAQQNQGANITMFNQLAYRKSQVPWTTPGQTDATEPFFYYQATTNYRNSSKYIHSGTNARLRNVRLSYDLSARLNKQLNMASCTFYVSGDNLYTMYSKDIVASDPEGPSVGQMQDFGNSSGSNIGIPRRYVFGLQVTF